MANKFGSFLKKRLFGKNRNLVSFDEPFEVMARLLKGHKVTGIIDAGASNGRISKRLLRKFPAAQAYAFEPNPLYTETLKQSAKDDPRFHPQFLALSDGEKPPEGRKRRRPVESDLFSLPLFKASTSSRSPFLTL